MFPLLLMLSLNRKSKIDCFDYTSPIFADASGYYSYLVTFFDASKINNLPNDIEHKTGFGFKISSDNYYGSFIISLGFNKIFINFFRSLYFVHIYFLVNKYNKRR